MNSGKAAGESDPRLIHTGYGQYTAGHRMSTRLRVFVWIVVAVAMAIWIAAIWILIVPHRTDATISPLAVC